MNVIFNILCELLISFIHIAIETPFVWLGEIVRWGVTLGRHKPRWDCYTEEYGGAFVLLSEISFWIGVVTAAAFGLGLKFLFFSEG
jgi:hypothetical protein